MEGRPCCPHSYCLRAVVSQAGFVVGLEAQVVLLALGSGLAGAPVVSQPPGDYGKALPPAAVTRAAA